MTESHFANHARSLPELAVGLIDDCLVRLEGPESLKEEATVHLVRVATKRLRAAWHLARGLAGKKTSRRRRRALRGLSAHLAGSRDRSVLLGLVEWLGSEESSLASREALETARKNLLALPGELDPLPRDLERKWKQVRGGLEEERLAWDSLENAGPITTRKRLRHSLRRSRKIARKDTREALHHEDPHLWHEWRKAMKRYRYQREFMAAIQERQLGVTDQRISRLGTHLGERNDLANLAHLVDHWRQEDRIDTRTHQALRKAIGRQEAGLKRHIRRLGRRFLRKT